MLKEEAFVYPHAKGFFIVEFDLVEHKDLILNSGSWFKRNLGLYMKPWTPSFDSFIDTLSIALVWVRLPNPPLHFWGLDSLGSIGKGLEDIITKALKQETKHHYIHHNIHPHMCGNELNKRFPT